MIKTRLPACSWLSLAVLMAASAGAELPSELSDRVSKATGFVLRPGVSSGTAVCVDAAKGLFITCNHVVNDGFFGGDTVTLVLDSGLKTQRQLTAKLISRSPDHDLALLWVAGDEKLVSIELAELQQLKKGAPVTSFGFPFGEARSARSFLHPTIVTKRGTISNLHRELHGVGVIQFLAFLDPGESGGPIVGDDGKIVGIVQSGMRKLVYGGLISVSTGESFGVSPLRVRELLERPAMTLVSETTIEFKSHAQPMDFAFKPVETWSKTPVGEFTAVLILPDDAGGKRELPLTPAGDQLIAKAVPLVGVADSIELNVRSQFLGQPSRGRPDRSLSALLPNKRVQIGARSVALNELKLIDRRFSPRAYTTDGRILLGDVKGMDDQPRFDIGEGKKLSVAQADIITVYSQTRAPAAVPIFIELRRGKDVVSKLDARLTMKNVPKEFASGPPIPALPGEQMVALPGKASRIVYGGGGRYVIAAIDALGLLVICDMEAGGIATTVPIDPANTLFAAGKTHFFVVDKGKKSIERWSFKTFEKDLSGPVPSEEVPVLAAMGYDSVNPLFLVTPRRTWVIHASTLKPMPLAGLEELGVGTRREIGIWPSNDGTRCAIAGMTSDPTILHLQLDKNLVTAQQGIQVPIAPLTARNFLRVHNSGRFASFGCGIMQPPAAPREGTDNFANRRRYVPIDDTNLCFTVAGRGDGSAEIDVRSLQNGDVVLELPRLPELAFVEHSEGVFGIMMDQRILWSPAAARLVTVATDNQRVFARRLDLKEEMDRRGSDYLYVKSVPTVDARPSNIYRYQPAVVFKMPLVEYSLTDPRNDSPHFLDAQDHETTPYTPPPGMTVSKTGLITWKVPEDIPAEGVRVRLYLKDADGNLIIQPFRLMLPLGERVLQTAITVPATRNRNNPVISVVSVKKGDVVEFTKPAGTWDGRAGPPGSVGGPSSKFYIGDRTGWMRLEMLIDKRSVPVNSAEKVTAEADCVLKFYCNDPNPDDNTGQMWFKITVKPAGQK